MEPEPNFSTPTLPNEKPKGGLILAILLGLLTFIVTGILAVIIIVILLPFKINLATLLLFGAWGGYAAIQFGLFILFALVGDFGTAVISWFVNRSKKLASITFVSALVFQIIALAVVIPATLKKSQETMNARIAEEKSHTQYAIIGDVSFELQEPFSESRGINGKLVDVSLSKKLVLIIPISVSQPGTYQINAQYNDSEIGSTPMKDVVQSLNVGPNTIRIEFLANESREYGYASPRSVKGTAQIQLSYLVSKKELLDSLKSDSTVNQKVLQQFMKDEGLNQGTSPDSTVNKFVGKKDIQF